MGTTIVDNTLLDATDECGERQSVSVWTGSQQNLYVFYIDSNGDLVYGKSTDHGKTWSGATVIDATDDYSGVAVWYDRWTQGDTTGNTIHIIAGNTTDNTHVYFSLGVDDDLPEAVNNVVIATHTAIESASPFLSICKAKSGNIFANGNAVTTAGVFFYKSVDAGATWADITTPAGGQDMSLLYTQIGDRPLQYPLNTDDDIIAVVMDDSKSELYYNIYDEVADEWSAQTIIQDSTAQDKLLFSQYHTVGYKKTNSDCFIFTRGPNNRSNIYVYKFDESTRTLGLPHTVTMTGGTASNARQSVNEIHAMCASWHEFYGILQICYAEGNDGGSSAPNYQISNDEGDTWGHREQYNNQGNRDDFPHTHNPAVYIDADESLFSIFTDDDDNDMFCTTPPLYLMNLTGVVKDNAGVAVSGAEVNVFQDGNVPNVGFDKCYKGSIITDGSGNYSFTIDKNGTAPYYFATATEARRKAPDLVENWEFNNRNPPAPGLWVAAGNVTNFSFDAVNREYDFTTAIAAAAGAYDWETEALSYEPFIGQHGFIIRAKVRIDTVTQGASTTRSGFYISTTDAQDNPSSGLGKVLGIAFTVTDTALKIEAFGGSDDADNLPNGQTFTHTTQVETIYVEIKRTGTNTGEIGIYSDENFTTLIEAAKSITHNWGSAAIIRDIMLGNESGDTGNVVAGAVEWIEIYKDNNDTPATRSTTVNAVDVSISRPLI